MQELLDKIQSDSMLMFIGAIAVAVLLAIVLVVVVSAMRVHVYKNRFKNLLIDNKEKSEHIVTLEKELQEYKIKDAKNIQELAQFAETKSTLKSANESFAQLQTNFNTNEKELSQVKATLEATKGRLDALNEEHEVLKNRFDVALEDNTKYRTTNARLLTKLENEERHSLLLKEQKEAKR